MLAGILAGIAIVNVELLSKKESTDYIIFYMLFPGILVVLFLILFHLDALKRLYTLLLLLGVGGLMHIGQFLGVRSLKYASAIVLAPFTYMIILFTGLIGWIMWGYVPDYITLSGFLLVILGGILTIILNKEE